MHYQISIFPNILILIAIMNFSLSLTIQLSLLLFAITFEGEKDRQLVLFNSLKSLNYSKLRAIEKRSYKSMYKTDTK